MSLHFEDTEDFSWRENQAYADIICEGLKQEDIERLEDLAAFAWGGAS